jgi:hypothetical protein
LGRHWANLFSWNTPNHHSYLQSAFCSEPSGLSCSIVPASSYWAKLKTYYLARRLQGEERAREREREREGEREEIRLFMLCAS